MSKEEESYLCLLSVLPTVRVLSELIPTLLKPKDGVIEVTENLQEGELLIIRGISKAIHAQKVNINNLN